MLTHPARTRADYHRAFTDECGRTYSLIDAFEARQEYALAPARYLHAAETLACPVKMDKQGHPRRVALWQHGRVLYAVVRELAARLQIPLTTLDIGTAKGYSALCVVWAIEDAGCGGTVHSVDVLDPLARVARHSVAEVDGLLTLAEFLAPWPEAQRIQFHQCTGIDWLSAHPDRLPFVYVDGKHNLSTVLAESALIRDRQEPGDVTVFDDVQIPDVAAALSSLKGYQLERFDLRPSAQRCYAIARRL